MKLFGIKSVSSVLSVLFAIAWPIVLVIAIAGSIMFVGSLAFEDKVDEFITAEMQKDPNTTQKDMDDWKMYKNTPVPVKFLMLPYGIAITVFLLMIISRSKALFDNLKKDIVFNASNVELMRRLNKALLIFSILTFNFSGLFTCILLLMLIEIFRSGTKLQEEHDLTV